MQDEGRVPTSWVRSLSHTPSSGLWVLISVSGPCQHCLFTIVFSVLWLGSVGWGRSPITGTSTLETSLWPSLGAACHIARSASLQENLPPPPTFLLRFFPPKVSKPEPMGQVQPAVCFGK